MKLLLITIALLAIIPLALFPFVSFQVRVGAWACFGRCVNGRVQVGTARLIGAELA